MAYRWTDLTFDLPEQVDDDTVLMFTHSANPPRYSLAVTRDVLGAGAKLSAYVDGALAELKGEVDLYEELGRRDRKVGPGDKLSGIEVHHRVALDEQQSEQLQLYVSAAGGVVVVTATAAQGAIADAQGALDHVAASLKA